MPNDKDQDGDGKKKPHRDSRAGRKAEKKKLKNPHEQELTDQQRNPKAFAINSAIRAERKFRRTQDLKSKKEHIPVIDRTPLEPPPILVAVVGPPKVGKTTLIKSLIKSFTRQPFSMIKGPVTVVSGKKRRITFIECNNDINCMVDLAKVADLVLLLIDASFGFEMEIFEFLNICQVHGMPRVMGVLTHLDILKQTKKIQKTKKELKRRFWTEVYAGAKLFYLSGMLHNEYLRNEIKNLARFISVMKFRPLTWQTSHSYIVADRMEDVTPPEDIRQNPKTDRLVCLYGYMRGIPMNKQSFIHIPGCGDFELRDMCFLSDPCPLPEVLKKRSLIEKERLVYAPFSGLGGIVYDKDAVYIDLPRKSNKKDEDDPMNEMVHTLVDSKETLNNKLAKSKFQLFSDSKPIKNEDFEWEMSKMKSESDHTVEYVMKLEDGTKRRKVIFNDDEDDVNNDGEEEIKGEDDASTDEEELEDEDGVKLSDQDEPETSSEDEISDNNSSDDESDYLSKPSRIKSLVKSEDIDKKKRKLNDSIKSVDTSGNTSLGKSDRLNKSNDGFSKTKIKNKKAQRSVKSIENIEESEDVVSEHEMDSDSETFSQVKMKEEKAKLKGVQNEKDRAIKDRISSILAEMDDDNKLTGEPSDEEDSDNDPGEVDIGSVPWQNQELESDDEAEDNDDDGSDDEEELEDDDDSDDNLPEATDLKWKENLAQKASDEFLERQANSNNLWKLVYGAETDRNIKEDEEDNDDENEVGGLFRVVSEKQENMLKNKANMNSIDSSKFFLHHLNDWTQPKVQEMIKDCFITGKWKMEDDASELLKLDDMNDEDLYGDFEDLETGEKFKSETKKTTGDKLGIEGDLTKEKIMEKKRKLKEKFDMEYDNGESEDTYFSELKNEANKQAELNRKEFEGLDDNQRVELEGFRSGLYVRMEIQAPPQLVEYFDPTYPLIAGGLQTGEQNIGYVKVRIKKHRWYNKILKNRDPLILSVGWRRFQTIGVYSKQEDNLRHRMLKYTPEHVACMGHFWGPITKSGTGFLALKNTVGNKEPGFRIMATGTVLDTNQSTIVTKKLKLTGEPLKIFKKTAFIKGMFTSSLEVAKFEGAKIKTVSGVRGQIKKAVNNPEGTFRATFEDKILLSDIVFCRTWYKVDIPQFYTAITTLMLPPEEKNMWQGMKTVGQLKRERCIHNPVQPDSMYTEITRVPRIKKPLIVPRALERVLPYQYKTKDKSALKKRQSLPFSKKLSKIVVRDEHESKVASMMSKLRMSFKEKEKKMRELKIEKIKQFVKQKKREQSFKNMKHKEIKKSIYRTLGQTSKSGV